MTNVVKLRVKGKENHREVWTVDSETDPFKHQRVPKPFIWGAFNGSEYHEFANASDLVEFLSTRMCLVYGHNAGKFDWHYLFDFIEPYTDVMVISGRIARFRIGSAEFRDSWNILPAAQATFSPKYEIDDWSIFEAEQRHVPANWERIRERLRTDCVDLWHVIDKFIADYGIHLTQAGAAMDIWSKLAGIEKPRTSAAFYGELEPYYFGGRVEVFHPGEYRGPYVKIDVNGLYPFAMMHNHPYGDTLHESLSLPNSRGGIERSFITLRCASHGALPYRDDDDSLTFPVDGRVRDHHVTGWEFLAAVETGCLTRSYDVLRVLTLPGTIAFREYQEHFAALKAQATLAGDTARREFAKRLSVSLYGKFGSKPDEYEEYQLIPPRFVAAAEAAEGWQFCCELGPHALVSRPIGEDRQHFYNVAVAASITGFGRAMFWRALREVNTPLYGDTDGIQCVHPGNLPLHETRQGAWKLEAVCDYGAFAGKKLYANHTTDHWRKGHPKCKEWLTASKGVKLSHDQIIKIARGETVLYTPDAPQYSVLTGIRFQSRHIKRTTT